ncbi:MAG: DUF378 domain-containing protein [Bacilli bacterium]|nr:DUF378 domain-containing protein [Bacilli bacterium]
MESLQKTALIFTIIGAIVWGIIGIFNFNIVDYLFVELLNIKFLANLIYIIVGICGIINIGILFNHIESK